MEMALQESVNLFLTRLRKDLTRSSFNEIFVT
jgi:hypothetical protein